jgi:ABC-type branched-subunit amino acid transport system permease subunit
MWMKIAIFALGSGLAGFAGALYAHFFRCGGSVAATMAAP